MRVSCAVLGWREWLYGRDEWSLCGTQTKPGPVEPWRSYCFCPEEIHLETSSNSLLLPSEFNLNAVFAEGLLPELNPSQSEFAVWTLPQQPKFCPPTQKEYSGTRGLSWHGYVIRPFNYSENAQLKWPPFWICIADVNSTLLFERGEK